ncbi:MAG: hypothetical protein AAFV59_07495 [Pseudomonadota bacterium]
MSELADISNIEFSSHTFPTEEDMKLWHSLSPEQQKAILLRDIDRGLASGISRETHEDLFQRALNHLAHAS